MTVRPRRPSGPIFGFGADRGQTGVQTGLAEVPRCVGIFTPADWVLRLRNSTGQDDAREGSQAL